MKVKCYISKLHIDKVVGDAAIIFLKIEITNNNLVSQSPKSVSCEIWVLDCRAVRTSTPEMWNKKLNVREQQQVYT